MPLSKGLKTEKIWYRQVVSSKLFLPLIFLLFIAVCFFLFNMFSIYRSRQLMLRDLIFIQAEAGKPPLRENVSLTNQYSLDLGDTSFSNATLTPILSAEIDQAFLDFLPPAEEPVRDILGGFGDTFSGLAYINREETDMFWDENITAFTLPPLYEFYKQNNCAEADCALSREALDPSLLCLKDACLRKGEDNHLFFKDKELQLPPSLRQETLRNITIFALADSWLIGAVTGPLEAERGWVYRFDGLSFYPLITDNSEHRIEARYQRGGGKISFGGETDDFLLIYNGYDGHAFRVRKDKIEDISEFFGLRVTGNGFLPQIFKLGNGGEATYYICSLTQRNPKLIKIWSNGEMASGGALDFSSLLFASNFQPQNILCALSDVKQRKIAVAGISGDTSELWSFQDKGFDNSRDRRVTSINLNNKVQANIKAAVFADIGVINSGVADNIKYYLANNDNIFEESSPSLWHHFSQKGQGLYWRLNFKPDKNNPFSSPCFLHINYLNYLFTP
jgi:hypothetical protein